MKDKKRFKLFIVLILILIAGISIYLGIYFTKLTKPKYIVGVGIDRLDTKITNYLSIDEKYKLGDTITINSTLDFDLDSEDYLKKSKTDKDYLDKYKTLKNLSKTTNNINYIQNSKKKKSLLEINSLLDKEKLLNYKYLIDNSTGYYYVEDIQKKYVNSGTNNYFEMLSDEATTLGNIEYIHEATIKALKNNLQEEYFEKYSVTKNINGSNLDVNQISIRIDDKKLHQIVNGIIKDLKEDPEANKILTSIDKDFAKRKVKDNKRLLNKDESYTLNIYTSKYRNIALKYELIHLDGDEKITYSYEGNYSKGNFYYIEDDTVIYTISITDDGKIIEGKVKDSTNKEVGTIKIEKNDASTYYTFNFDDGKKKYDVIYSSKNNNLVNNKSFTNEKKLSFKYIDEKVSILSGEVTLNSEITKTGKIEEDISEAVLSSTLSDEIKAKYDNKKDNIIERLKK